MNLVSAWDEIVHACQSTSTTPNTKGPVSSGPPIYQRSGVAGEDRDDMMQGALQKAPTVLVVTSWDDADAMTGKLAGLLDKFGLKATFFVPCSYQTRRGIKRIGDDQVRDLASRFEVGPHSLTHPTLTGVPLEKVIEEVQQSKLVLERMIGKSVESFAYPNGRYDSSIATEVERAGYLIARTSEIYRRDLSASPFTLPTTMQARIQPPLTLSLPYLVHFGGLSSLAALWRGSWVDLAKFLFGLTLKRGGVFHLWGHAWEIEQMGAWSDLQALFEHLSGRKQAKYCSVGDLARLIFRSKAHHSDSTSVSP